MCASQGRQQIQGLSSWGWPFVHVARSENEQASINESKNSLGFVEMSKKAIENNLHTKQKLV